MENNFFAENGYYHVKGLYTESELSKVRPILDKFHHVENIELAPSKMKAESRLAIAAIQSS